MASQSQLPIGGHPIINPFGQVVSISQRSMRALDIRGYLHRDALSGLKSIDVTHYLVFLEMERGTDLFRELGEDCSGPNSVICYCEDCLQREVSNIDKTPLPGRNKLMDDETSRIVQEVKAKYERRR